MAWRGQGAMEYLMSYGWAVLVVLIVGVTMWQLGLFNLGGSNPPTFTGFQALKPLLPSCEDYAKMDYAGDHDGFVCQFANNAGAPIMLKRITQSVNGKYCEWSDTSVIKRFDANPHQIMTWWVQTTNGPQFPSPIVYNMPGWVPACVDVSVPDCGLTVPADNAFFIAVGCCTAWKMGGGRIPLAVT